MTQARSKECSTLYRKFLHLMVKDQTHNNVIFASYKRMTINIFQSDSSNFVDLTAAQKYKHSQQFTNNSRKDGVLFLQKLCHVHCRFPNLMHCTHKGIFLALLWEGIIPASCVLHNVIPSYLVCNKNADSQQSFRVECLLDFKHKLTYDM